MNNSKFEVPKEYPKYSHTCAFILMNLEKASQDTEEAFQTRLAFFKKLISEKGIH